MINSIIKANSTKKSKKYKIFVAKFKEQRKKIFYNIIYNLLLIILPYIIFLIIIIIRKGLKVIQTIKNNIITDINIRDRFISVNVILLLIVIGFSHIDFYLSVFIYKLITISFKKGKNQIRDLINKSAKDICVDVYSFLWFINLFLLILLYIIYILSIVLLFLLINDSTIINGFHWIV